MTGTKPTLAIPTPSPCRGGCQSETRREAAESADPGSMTRVGMICAGDIERVRAAQPAAVRGRFNILADGRLGRFGWKAQAATLVEFMEKHSATKSVSRIHSLSGISSKAAARRMAAPKWRPRHSHRWWPFSIQSTRPRRVWRAGTRLERRSFRQLGAPPVTRHLFLDPAARLRYSCTRTCCCTIWAPASRTDSFRVRHRVASSGTMPLWRVADRQHFLHDGRATTIIDAIQAHAGQAEGARSAFRALSSTDLQALLEFLNCI